jgi:two-component system sensor histidine kinase TtrS
MALWLLSVGPPLACAADVAIGVLSPLGEDDAREVWLPLESALEAALPQTRVEMRYFDLAGLTRAVETGAVDFVITNPGHYVALESRFGVTRIATQAAGAAGDPAHVVGATVIVPARPGSPADLAALRGGRLAAVAPEAFGGFQVIAAELLRQGIDIEDGDLQPVFTGFPMTRVVEAVLRGDADAGVIRTCLLERWIAEGIVAPEQLRVLSPVPHAAAGCVASSPLYPGWALAALPGTSHELGRNLLMALLALPPGRSEYAWSIPADYHGVHAMLRELRTGPYAFLRETGMEGLARRYWPALAALAALLALWLVYTLRVEQLVQRRTRELSGAVRAQAALAHQVQTAKEQMDHLSRLSILGELSGTLAHELNQPLATIANYAQSLRRRVERSTLSDDATLQAADEIQAQAERAARILAGIRDFARKRGRVRAAAVLADLVAEAVGLFRGMLANAPEVHVVDWLPRGQTVLVDALQIQQVLLNLLKNAWDARRTTQSGDDTIEVMLDAGAGLVRVAVRDRGVGIAEELREHLFEPFFTTRKDGLGLGLPICKTIVEAHGGCLAGTPAPDGQGMVFRFTLPFPPADVTGRSGSDASRE